MIRRLLASTQVMVLGFGFLSFGFIEPAAAACAAPTIAVSPLVGPPGSGMTVSGKYFTPDCNDTISCTPEGCETPAPHRPQKQIEIRFKQGERNLLLSIVDANPDLNFSVATSVPSDTQPGPATIEASPAQPVTFTVGPPARVRIRDGNALPRPDDGSKRPTPNREQVRDHLRQRVQRERPRLVADPDDQDAWAPYVAAAGALAIIGLAIALRRREPGD